MKFFVRLVCVSNLAGMKTVWQKNGGVVGARRRAAPGALRLGAGVSACGSGSVANRSAATAQKRHACLGDVNLVPRCSEGMLLGEEVAGNDGGGAAGVGRRQGLLGMSPEEERHRQRAALLSANQALLTTKAGATFIYGVRLARIDDTGGQRWHGAASATSAPSMITTATGAREILAASIRNVLHVKQAALDRRRRRQRVPPSVLRALTHHPLTDKALSSSWQI